MNQGITKQVSGDKNYPITYEDLNPSNLPSTGRGSRTSGIRVVNNGKKIELKDSRGADANVEFEIRSTSPGVSARFSDDGRELKVKGSGDVTIRLKYDDNPNYAGEAVRSITIAGTTWRKERKHKGEETKTIKVSGSGSGSKPNIRLRNAGETVVQMEEHTDNDWKDMCIRASVGKFHNLVKGGEQGNPINTGTAIFRVDRDVRFETVFEEILTPGKDDKDYDDLVSALREESFLYQRIKNF